MFKKEDFGAIEELRKTLGAIVGVKNLEERVGLEYVLTVGEEKDKIGAEKVIEFLKNQAQKFNIDLEAVVATEQEMKEVREKLMVSLSKGKA